MENKKRKLERGDIWNSILLIYSILGFHILLIIGLVVLVIVLQGFLEYTLWIFSILLALLLGSGFWIWRKFKKRKENLADILNNPSFKGRDVEVSFLGGTVNFKFGAQDSEQKGQKALQGDGSQEPLQLEDRETTQVRELKELSRMMEKGLITQEEYNRAKKRLLENNE